MTSGTIRDSDGYRLDNVRGPRLKLALHAEACSLAELPIYIRDFQTQPIAVDLFCGAGGLSLGLQRAGFRLALGVDNNALAIETHAAHFPGASTAKDLAVEDSLDEVLQPLRGHRIDLLAGGPPCQPFSMAARWIRST